MTMLVALEIYLTGSLLMAVPFGRYLRRAGGRTEVRQLHPAGSDLEEQFRVASAR